MPALPARPQIRLRAPKEIVPGVPFELQACLHAGRKVDIEFLDLRVEGLEAIADGDASIATPAIAPLVARLSGPRTLDPGETMLACRATLPHDAPPSFVGRTRRIDYVVHAHASVAWWPDARTSFALTVVSSPHTQAAVGVPRVAASRAGGPVPGEAYVELSLATDVVAVGGVVEGAVALEGAFGPRKLVVRVVTVEITSGHPPARGTAYEILVPTAESPEGAEIPFAIRLPQAVPASFGARSFRVEHWVEAAVVRGFGARSSASLPIRVVASGAAPERTRSLVPHVGDARLEALFAERAEAVDGSVEQGPSLVLRRGEVVGRVTRVLGSHAPRLRLTATFPSWNLGLHVQPAGLAQRVLFGGIRSGDVDFDRANAAHARDDAQSREVLARIAPLVSCLTLHLLADDELIVEGDRSPYERSAIEQFVARALPLLDALAIPPPLPLRLRDAAREWKQLAAWLGAPLQSGHARVDGAVPGARVAVQTSFDDERPVGTRVVVVPDDPVPLEQPIIIHQRTDVVGLTQLSPDARALLDRLARSGAIEIRSDQTTVTIDAPLCGAFRPFETVRRIVGSVLALQSLLRPTHGPFR